MSTPKDMHAELMRLAEKMMRDSWATGRPGSYDATRDELDAFARTLTDRITELERFEFAYKEWSDKTEWVQRTARAQELGKHRADVMRSRITELEAQLAAVGAVGSTVHQYRVAHCADWYDGHPDTTDGKAYQTRTLYTSAQPADQPAPAVVGPVQFKGGMTATDQSRELDAGFAAQDYCRSKWGAARGHSEWRRYHDAFVAGYLASPQPHQIAEPAITQAARDVLAERQRQIRVGGWTPEHDDSHDSGQMAGAASCYAQHVNARCWVVTDLDNGPEIYSTEPTPDNWPWDDSWWKPTTPRRDAVKACALLLAEIERIDRADATKEQS